MAQTYPDEGLKSIWNVWVSVIAAESVWECWERLGKSRSVTIFHVIHGFLPPPQVYGGGEIFLGPDYPGVIGLNFYPLGGEKSAWGTENYLGGIWPYLFCDIHPYHFLKFSACGGHFYLGRCQPFHTFHGARFYCLWKLWCNNLANCQCSIFLSLDHTACFFPLSLVRYFFQARGGALYVGGTYRLPLTLGGQSPLGAFAFILGAP